MEILDVCLHVGLGTFRPVKEENVLDHHMHSEFYMISEEVADKLNKAKANGQRIIAVGTTSTRTLEANMKNMVNLKQQVKIQISLFTLDINLKLLIV